MAEKKRAKGLAARSRKMGERSRKRENAFKDLEKQTNQIGATTFKVDQKLLGEIRRLERKLKDLSIPPVRSKRKESGA